MGFLSSLFSSPTTKTTSKTNETSSSDTSYSGYNQSASSGSSNTNPWSAVIPYATTQLSNIGQLQNNGFGLTTGQAAAYSAAAANAAEGHPFAGSYSNLANTLLSGTPDRTGTVTDAYNTLKVQLTPYASGAYTNPDTNPYLQTLINRSTENAANAVNSQFAAAGRGGSGGYLPQNIAKGVSYGTADILSNFYNDAQNRQINAANTLYNAGQNTSATQSALDAQRASTMLSGVTAGEAARSARDYGANELINIENAVAEYPYKNASYINSLLSPWAAAGSSTTTENITSGANSGTTSTDTTSSSSTTGTQKQSGGLWSQLLGAGLAGYGLYKGK